MSAHQAQSLQVQQLLQVQVVEPATGALNGRAPHRGSPAGLGRCGMGNVTDQEKNVKDIYVQCSRMMKRTEPEER